MWLCRPGLADDPCTTDETATVVGPDGTTTVQTTKVDPDAPVDCFYVYPTVSSQTTVNANLTVEPIERAVAHAQASRFASRCRVFAPMYRQLTLSAIRSTDPAIDFETAGAIAYRDVANAWKDYLAHDNHGRGVVLIGHSQGAAMLTALIRRQIDNDPAVRSRLISALLLGGNIVVPEGKDVGGDFHHVPACRKPSQTACVVAYSSFSEPPPPDAVFGRVETGINRLRGTPPPHAEVLCVNPAALDGGAATLQPYFPTHAELGVLAAGTPVDELRRFTTPWVTFAGILTGECRSEDGANWLQVTDTRSDPDAHPRIEQGLGGTWGLHLLDVNVALGDLVDLVGHQVKGYVAAHG